MHDRVGQKCKKHASLTGSRGFVEAQVMTVDTRMRYLFSAGGAVVSPASDGTSSIAAACFSNNVFRTEGVVNTHYVCYKIYQ